MTMREMLFWAGLMILPFAYILAKPYVVDWRRERERSKRRRKRTNPPNYKT
jgi:preprotein translocase subunit YajC